MFIGEHYHTLDTKGRLTVPSSFRKLLCENFVLTVGLDECLIGYTFEKWTNFAEKIRQLNYNKKQIREFIRVTFSKAAILNFDSQGRVCIPKFLREYAHLKKDVVIVGLLDRFELWDRKIWLSYSQTALNNYEENAEAVEKDEA